MQPGEEIESLLDELAQIVQEGKPTFGGGGQKRVVDSAEILDIIDEIHEKFPEEFQIARRILKEEDETIARANQQADAIIEDARQQAMVLASDQEVVRRANAQADSIRDQAQQYERDTRYNAEEYADTVLSHLEENLKSLINNVTRVRQTLNENSGANNESNDVKW